MPPRVVLVVLIALTSLLLPACEGSSSIAAAPNAATPPPIAPAAPAITRTPSGIFISTSVPVLNTSASVAVTTATPAPADLILLGRVYDVSNGQRLSNATIDWQFLALGEQQHNGQLQVPDDGFYRLQLPVRNSDEVIITARAPGYLPSMARLLGRQLNPYGSRLNFGLVKTNGPVPTLPGTLGTIQLSGIVYNLARGLMAPIGDARVIIINRSLVEPETQLETTTNLTGTFVIPLMLHTTDQIEVTITAGGYLTTTLNKSAKDLADKPQLSIGLRPAPNP